MPTPTPPPPASAANQPPVPPISLETLSFVLGDPTRCRILARLAGGEQLLAVEIAEQLGRDAPGISKQLRHLRQAGIVVQGRNRLNALAPQFRPAAGNRVLDFGLMTLRAAQVP